MHGQIHDCLRRMILENVDRNIWDKILERANAQDDQHFIKLRHYEDELTLTLIGATAEVLELTLGATLEAYGKYFIKYALDLKYAHMLKALGPNIRCFLEHLDTVHTLLAVSYHNIVPPIFRAECCEDGNLLLHYYSIRKGLEMLVVGLVEGAADLIYNTQVDVSVVSTSLHVVSETETLYHAIVKVYLPEELRSLNTVAKQVQGTIEKTLGFHFNDGCPFSSVVPPTETRTCGTRGQGEEPEGIDLNQTAANLNGVVMNGDLGFDTGGAICGSNEEASISSSQDTVTETMATDDCASLRDSHVTCPHQSGRDNSGINVAPNWALSEGRINPADRPCSSPVLPNTCHPTGRSDNQQVMPTPQRSGNSTSGLPPSMSLKVFSLLFPYHVVFNRKLIIQHCGDTVTKLCHSISAGNSMADVFSVVYPRVPLAFDAILEFFNACFVLRVHELSENAAMLLKGQMAPMDGDHVIFICSPKLRTLDELTQKGVWLADLSIYDATREFVLLNQLRQAELNISLQLEEMTFRLEQTALALEREKSKTDVLLQQMLPPKVAEQLKAGKQVEAEKFSEVTILFSDIVTFTNMASKVPPMEIVNMLNKLYSHFDALTNKHGVYKVETIGDAYMVVGGAPEVSKVHAQSVADLALDLMVASKFVTSPATGEPLQIRVGLHSGSVVAGVVGDKMPRYCLFGDTVNTASRMESHSLPCKIHLSAETQRLIKEDGYVTMERGQIKIKGKGKMTTYFLIGGPGGESKMTEISSRFTEVSSDESRKASKIVAGRRSAFCVIS